MAKDESVGALDLIRSNIEADGHHVYVVAGGPLPRFVYSIGLSEVLGSELVLAGASMFTAKETRRIIDCLIEPLSESSQDDWPMLEVEVESLGSFSIQTADPSWSASLMLGGLHYYGVEQLVAAQIAPDELHRTIDVPNLCDPWDVRVDPPWRWLHEPWDYSVSSRSVVVTNIDALRGQQVTEVARWEDTEWEMFAGAGPDVPPEEVRVVPLGTLLATDSSLEAAIDLELGQGLWRDQADSNWHPWSRSS